MGQSLEARDVAFATAGRPNLDKHGADEVVVEQARFFLSQYEYLASSPVVPRVCWCLCH